MCNMAYLDPRGPHRTVTSVEPTPGANLTRFVECDHVAHLNPSFTAARAGDMVRCYACGQDAIKSAR